MSAQPGMAMGQRTGRAFATGGIGRFIIAFRSRVTLEGIHDPVLEEAAIADLVLEAEAIARDTLGGLVGSRVYVISAEAAEALLTLAGDETGPELAGTDAGQDLGLTAIADPEIGLEGSE